MVDGISSGFGWRRGSGWVATFACGLIVVGTGSYTAGIIAGEGGELLGEVIYESSR